MKLVDKLIVALVRRVLKNEMAVSMIASNTIIVEAIQDEVLESRELERAVNDSVESAIDQYSFETSMINDFEREVVNIVEDEMRNVEVEADSVRDLEDWLENHLMSPFVRKELQLPDLLKSENK